jgi:hypothetical protein
MAPSPEGPLEESRAGTGRRRFVAHGWERPAQAKPSEVSERCEPAVPAPRRWGLSAEAVAPLGDRLSPFWLRCRGCFTPRTRDTSEHAYAYLRAQLTMDTERPLANLDRTLNGGEGQALPPCMANAPGAGPAVFDQRPAELTATPALAHGSTLRRDERADEQAGTPQVGASRQDHGRRGQGAVCRGDPCLPYAKGGLWAMVDGALFLPEEWLGEACAPRRRELGSPPERRLAPQSALGLKMVTRVKAKGGPGDLWACDAL